MRGIVCCGKKMKRSANLFLQAIRATIAFKLRSFFCVLSVALGIASITLIVAATEGAYKKAYDMVERFGPDSIMVVGGSNEATAIGNREKTLILDDVKAIKESFPGAYLVVPVSLAGSATAAYRNKKYQTLIIGSDDNYSRAWSWPVVQGMDITKKDVRGTKNICLIGRHLSRELFGERDPVGKFLFARGLPVQVVGVLQERGTTPRGHNLDNRIVMPITTVMKKLLNERKYISLLRIRFINQKNLDFYTEEIKNFLRKRHRLIDGEPDDFTIISPKEIIKFLVGLTGSLILFLGISGIISLIVAGFVLANLFLLSVKERSSEIGIRRSIGARQQDILLQFMGESVILTTAGGLLGFLVGIIASKFLMLVAEFPICFSWKAFVAGLIMSWIIGIVFGLQPSLRAARLRPIEAIRK